jgi:hypothetical protein
LVPNTLEQATQALYELMLPLGKLLLLTLQSLPFPHQ